MAKVDDVEAFEIDGSQFQLPPLGVEAQLRALALVAPVLAALRKSASFADTIASLDNLQPLYTLFAKNAKVKDANVPAVSGAFFPLAQFGDMVFARRPTLLVAFLAECVRIELGDFLAADGQTRLASIGSRFAFLTKSTGGSGA